MTEGIEQSRALSHCAGVVATACTQEGNARNTGSPLAWCRNNQPDAREGQAGRLGVAERFVVPGKSGNADGGKEP